jgi:hypothetical protein
MRFRHGPVVFLPNLEQNSQILAKFSEIWLGRNPAALTEIRLVSPKYDLAVIWLPSPESRTEQLDSNNNGQISDSFDRIWLGQNSATFAGIRQ